MSTRLRVHGYLVIEALELDAGSTSSGNEGVDARRCVLDARRRLDVVNGLADVSYTAECHSLADARHHLACLDVLLVQRRTNR